MRRRTLPIADRERFVGGGEPERRHRERPAERKSAQHVRQVIDAEVHACEREDSERTDREE